MQLTVARVLVYFFYTVTLTVTADDIVNVYHGGDVVLTGDEWEDAQTLNLDDACVLAIKGTNVRSGAGILASTSTGVVTDASWKCSSSGSGAVEQTSWHLAGFDDAAWSQARVVAPNDASVWPRVVAGINPAAQWIWSQDASDDVIYCRKTLC